MVYVIELRKELKLKVHVREGGKKHFAVLDKITRQFNDIISIMVPYAHSDTLRVAVLELWFLERERDIVRKTERE